jgi:futalosine hydrolase
MRILLVAATKAEVTLDTHHMVLITGVGMVNTALHLSTHLALHRGSYDLAINMGVAGAFDPETELGSVFQISEDSFADLGAEDHDRFLTLPEMGLMQQDDWTLPATHHMDGLPCASAITVNTVHGNRASIAALLARHPVHLESMEGAAFFTVCRHFALPAVQIRAVSNHVLPRDRSKWQLALAVSRLNEAVSRIAQ